MASELATGYISLTVKYDNAMKQINKDFANVADTAKKSGANAGKQFSAAATSSMNFDGIENKLASVGRIGGKALGGALTLGVAAAATGITAVLGTALTKGFSRLKSIDDAQFKLRALGNSAADVQKIMDSALAAVKGTAFGLGDAATVAANAVAAGVKPGKELTKYLKLTADASAIAGTELSDMGRIINQVRTGQKAYTEDLNQLADRGIPIYQWLAEEAGVAASEVKKMAADGAISSEMFEAAISRHIGGAAQTMGESFTGSVQNAEAALGRLGEAFLKPVFGNAAGGIGSITDSLDGLTAWIDANQDTVIGFWEGMGNAAVYFGQSVLATIGGVAKGLAEFVNVFGDTYAGITRAVAAVNRVLGRTEIADQLDADADAAFGWADSLYKLSDGSIAAADKLGTLHDSINTWGDSARKAAADTANAADKVTGLGTALGQLPLNKTVTVDADTAPAEATMQSWFDKWKSIIAAPPTPTPSGPTNPLTAPLGGGRAAGGSIFGPGGPKSDIIPIWASNGEHMLSAKDVAAMGGQSGVYAFRQALHRAGGGAIDAGIAYAAAISGLPYSYGGVGPSAFDCSGAQSAVFAAFTGKPQGTRYFTTESNFEALGFVKGFSPGAYNIGISRGGGGHLSHMGATLPNGVTFEAGGNNGGVMYGDGARGASSFPLQYYLPIAGGDPSGGATSPGGTAGGGTGGGGGSGGGGAGGGGGSNLMSKLGELADIGVGGIKETFLPPGFSDPTTWPNVQSLAALLQWGGGMIGGIPGQGNKIAGGILSGAGSAITGSGSGLVNAIGSVTPAPFGTLAPTPTAAQFAPGQPGVGTGPAPGPAPGPGTQVSIGTVNEPTQSIITAANRQTTADQTPHLGSRRFV